MLKTFELLAPAGNKDIGIAAIDCGADAVYIAGPSFGAREAASNSLSDVEELARYVHRFGAKVYLTVNTILKDEELEPARQLITAGYEAGCDAIIVQDLGILEMPLPPIPLFASTQCNIRTPAQARWLESLGFKRLILARELALGQIKEIREAVSCDLETFIHGALCVSYSGQCYMSCHLTGRSANRGACIQACRSRYDVEDENGKTIVKDKAVLSLKDLNLADRLPDLISAGITSFKIEGRLKNVSYVRNVVRMYRQALDGYPRSSFGSPEGGFQPHPDATFSRGFTQFFIDGARGQWSSMETAKGVGEAVGTVQRVLPPNGRSLRFEISPGVLLNNGDGLCFRGADGQVVGMRVDIASGNIIEIKGVQGLRPGTLLYRNFNISFERELERHLPRRLMRVEVSFGESKVSAVCEDGHRVEVAVGGDWPKAENRDLAERNIRVQIGKVTEPYRFEVVKVAVGDLPFISVSGLNAIRRELAQALVSSSEVERRNYVLAKPIDSVGELVPPEQRVRLNCLNSLSRKIYERVGVETVEAFETSRDVSGEYGELMRTKYCLRNELGICPRQKKGGKAAPLFLLNNGRKFKVSFDCRNCENVIAAL